MLIAKNIQEVRKAKSSSASETWGFVPTMGLLHEGHLSLIQRAKEENEKVAVSIFVNAIQFNDKKDFNNYPRDLTRDLQLLEGLQLDLVFIPDHEEIYPHDFQSRVIVDQYSEILEGAARPDHFNGVTTVVAKLFNIIAPTKAYFGQKDAQQLFIIRKMVNDLNFNIEIIGCPSVRNKNGLALSSRNTLLNREALDQAPVLFEALKIAESEVIKGNYAAKNIILKMQLHIQSKSLARIDYIAINETETLKPVENIKNETLVSLAVFFGQVRLIDNIIIKSKLN